MKDEFIEHPAAVLFGPMPDHDGFSGNLAVKDPVVADEPWRSLLPYQETFLQAHVRDVAPSPARIDGPGDPVGNTAGT
jgi:hypothetical protein